MELEKFDPSVLTHEQMIQQMSQNLNYLLTSKVREEADKAEQERLQAEKDIKQTGITLMELFIVLTVIGMIIAFTANRFANVSDSAQRVVDRNELRNEYIEKTTELIDQGATSAQLDKLEADFEKQYNAPAPDTGSNIDWSQIMLYGLTAIGIAVLIALIYQGIKFYKLRGSLTRSEHEQQKDVFEKAITNLIAPAAKVETMQALEDLYVMHNHVEQNPRVWQHFTKDLSNLYSETVLAGHLVQKVDDYLVSRMATPSPAQLDLNKKLLLDRKELLDHVTTMADRISLLRGEMLRIETTSLKSGLNSEGIERLIDQARAQHEVIKIANITAKRSIETKTDDVPVNQVLQV